MLGKLRERKRLRSLFLEHADRWNEQPEAMQRNSMTDEEHNRLDPLFRLADQLDHSLQPVQPSVDYVRRLRQEVLEGAESQIALTKRVRRTAILFAATLGSLLSIASLVGAIVFLVARLRARQQTSAVHAPTG
jgi:hypothetical protein